MLTASLLALVTFALSGVSASKSLSLTVTGPDTVSDLANLKLTTTLTNTGDEALTLLNDPRSTLSSFETNSFAVTSAKGSPDFTGALVKYVPATAAKLGGPGAFTTLAPGESKEVVHTLSKAYDFSSSTAGLGTYSVSPLTTFYYVDSTFVPIAIEASLASGPSGSISKTVGSAKAPFTFTLTGGLEARAPAPELERRATFIGCNSTRQGLINTATTNAQTYASNSYTYINGITAGTNRYNWWFGTYTATRRNLTRSHFNSISSSGFSTFTYDCTCTSSAYAYVYANQFGKIWLCNAFWSAPATGTDSKAGTLVHESSHFNAHGGTQDYAYGQTAAHNLALSNPNNAVMNADNHEYFAENTPFRS